MKYIKVNEDVNNDIDQDIINLGNSNTSINKRSSKHPDYNITDNKSDIQSEKERFRTIVTEDYSENQYNSEGEGLKTEDLNDDDYIYTNTEENNKNEQYNKMKTLNSVNMQNSINSAKSKAFTCKAKSEAIPKRYLETSNGSRDLKLEINSLDNQIDYLKSKLKGMIDTNLNK